MFVFVPALRTKIETAAARVAGWAKHKVFCLFELEIKNSSKK